MIEEKKTENENKNIGDNHITTTKNIVNNILTNQCETNEKLLERDLENVTKESN